MSQLNLFGFPPSPKKQRRIKEVELKRLSTLSPSDSFVFKSKVYTHIRKQGFICWVKNAYGEEVYLQGQAMVTLLKGGANV